MLGWGSALIAENKELAAYGNLLDTSQAPGIVLDQVIVAATHVESKAVSYTHLTLPTICSV